MTYWHIQMCITISVRVSFRDADEPRTSPYMFSGRKLVVTT